MKGMLQLAPKVQGAIAKWLRRQIRNLFSFGGAGSNPAGVANLLIIVNTGGLKTLRLRELAKSFPLYVVQYLCSH